MGVTVIVYYSNHPMRTHPNTVLIRVASVKSGSVRMKYIDRMDGE